MTDATAYLQPGDLINFGVPSGSDQLIRRASRLIDGYCKRGRWGLTWVPDYAGNPCYMASAAPDLIWTAVGGVAPGSNIVVPVNGPPPYPEIIGRPVVLDAANPSLCESAIITAINTPTRGTITLDVVANSHAGPTQLQGGMQVFEERNLPSGRSITRVSQWPVQRVVSGLGRYSYGRRSQQVEGNYSDFGLLSILQQFGGPPAWVAFETQQIGINPGTGELWIPAGVLLAYYSDVRLHYVAGWSIATLPVAIKQACANIVLANQQVAGTPMASSLFRRVAAGDISVERFAEGAIDDETKEMLQPFRARLLF